MSAQRPIPANRLKFHAHSTTKINFQRAQDRLRFFCPVMFAGVATIGEGLIHNISPVGCTVECDRAVLQGSYMKLRLLLPDSLQSLAVELAAVRWAQKPYFGVEFLRMSPEHRARLRDFLIGHLRA
jgi:hypothetical protein